MHEYCHHLMYILVRSAANMGLMSMRTTMNLDDNLLTKAEELTGIKEKTALVRAGLVALIERESAQRLAKLAGSEPQLMPTPRQRPSKQ